MMTRPEHPSGTDRIRECLDQMDEKPNYLINIQGDEPFIRPQQINALARVLDGKVELGSMFVPLKKMEFIEDPNRVKVLTDSQGLALYFSRHPIPYQRDLPRRKWIEGYTYKQHLGIYAYRADVLEAISELPPSPLEQAERLEQLRWLEAGYRIQMVESEYESLGIDTPEDLERIAAAFGSMED
jgi:3-deoxy-manno-octulosonate cytidylyltransferase (CMP-KDO synthetase)